MEIFWDQVSDLLSVVKTKTFLVLTTICSFILIKIGYPKEIIAVIMFLVVVDVLVKWYSIVVIHYGRFTLGNFFRGWRDRNLTSRGVKNGLGIKVILYLPILFVAHQADVIPEIIYGSEISKVLYTALVLIEARSIMESLADAGHTRILPFLDFLDKKAESAIGTKVGEKDVSDYRPPNSSRTP